MNPHGCLAHRILNPTCGLLEPHERQDPEGFAGWCAAPAAHAADSGHILAHVLAGNGADPRGLTGRFGFGVIQT